MDVALTSHASSRNGSRLIATGIEQPRLTKTDYASIHEVPREYHQYAREANTRP